MAGLDDQAAATTESRLTPAQKWAREHPMRFRKKFGVALTTYSPGWSLEIGGCHGLWISWHVLTRWRWGHPVPRLVSLSLHQWHVGKRLLTWKLG